MLNKKSIKNKFNTVLYKVLKSDKVLKILMATIYISLISSTTFANTSTTQIDNVTKWIATWVSRVGAAVAFFGAVQAAFGFKNDDADAKTRGFKTLASGFMVMGITESLSMFGL